jgi:hypothetical protein
VENIIGLVEISKRKHIIVATCYDTPIWQFVLFSKQDTLLPFMVKSDNIEADYYKVSELKLGLISYREYTKLKDVREYPESFFQDRSSGIVYFHNKAHFPFWVLYAPYVNIIYGLSTDKPLDIEGIHYASGGLSLPAIKDSADNLEYTKMKFKTGSYDLINTKGQYDNAGDFFGNDFSIKHSLFPYTFETTTLDFVYYVSNIKIKLDKTTFSLTDKRKRLSAKIPNEVFTYDDYKFGESPTYNQGNLYGKTKQDVYGYCINVPAICINAAQAISNESYNFTFRVARKITKLEKIEVKMTQPNEEDPGVFAGEVWTDQTGYAAFNYEEGTFTLNKDFCMPEFTSQRDYPDMYEVRVTGFFHPADTPLKILKTLLIDYCSLDWEKDFNKAEIESEIGEGTDVDKIIGVMFDKPTDIYAAIEQLQSASVAGWKLTTSGEKFSARRDDDENRILWGKIETQDITNLDEVEIDFNADNYATIIDVSYAKDYYEDDRYQHIIDDSQRQHIFSIYGLDKTYEAGSLLKEKNDAVAKATNLAKFFSRPRQMINGVILFGTKWLTLRVYDIVEIDLTADTKVDIIESRIVRTREYGSGNIIAPSYVNERYAIATQRRKDLYRTFGGVIKCKVMSIKIDLNKCTNTIDLLFVGQDRVWQ